MKKQGLNRKFALIALAAILSSTAALGGCNTEDVTSVSSKVSPDSSETVSEIELNTSVTPSSSTINSSDKKPSSKTDGTASASSKVPSVERKLDSQKAISTAVKDLSKTLPQIKHYDKLSGGNVSTILVDKGMTENEVASILHDSILELLEYDLYLEHINTPNQAQPVILDHMYSLKYEGLFNEGAQHKFSVRFIMNEQKYSGENFKSDDVIAIATEKILNDPNPMLDGMSVMTDREYSEVRMIKGVQTYENTQQAADNLAQYTKTAIIGARLGIKEFSQFKIEFYSKGNTSYTFILYLK